MRRDNKKRLSGRFISILAIIIVICSADLSFAVNGETEYLKQEPVYGISNIWYMLLDTANTAYGWEFPYTDSFFRNPSEEFSLKLAQGSLGLACSAFRSNTGLLDYKYKEYLGGAGFTDLYAFGYDKETAEDTLSGVIGKKQIDDFTVIAAVTCGQGYGKEWAGNFKIGNGVRHEGFQSAADQLEAYLEQYISDNNIDGKKKLWLAGMSRAAAIGNITAADMIEGGEYEDVYAYLFGVPRTTKEPVAYKGIFNINGQYDPVASIPFESWGYERYGIDLYTPAQESDTQYPMYARKAKAVGDKMADGFRNNPEVNYQLRLSMEAIDELFKTSDDYSERLQPLIIDAMHKHSENELFGIIRTAVGNVVPKDRKERQKLEEYVDYLSYIAGQHMRASQRQIQAGSWNPDEALEANLVIEHRPSTYIKWLFSQDDPARLFSCGTESRRVTFIGDVGVEVYRDGKGISAISKKGYVYVPGGSGEQPESNSIFLMRNGSQTTVSLPANAEYDMVITAQENGPLLVYDLLISAGKLRPEPGMMYTGRVTQGKYGMKIKAGEPPEPPVELDEDNEQALFKETAFKYSPAYVMSNEIEATKGSYLSISGAYDILRKSLWGIAAFILACIVIHIIHRYKMKRGHPPYSDWYMIAPHLICIAAMAALTQYAAFYMFVIGSVRAQCAAGTVAFISLLALRGAIRSRQPFRLLIAGGLMILAHLTGLYYNKLPIDSFSVLNMIVFFAAVALLSMLAIRMFKREKQCVPEPEVA